MRYTVVFMSAVAFVAAMLSQDAVAVSILAPGDTILAIDEDGLVGGSSSPGGEPPSNSFDGGLGKYLNFAGKGSGVIVTPVSGASVLKSLQLTTANDADGRDPTSVQVWGTNDAIASANDSIGLGESWSLIDDIDLVGALELPSTRNTLGPLVDLSGNTDSYTSYKILFPTLKGAGQLFQIAEISIYSDAAGTTDIDSSSDPTVGIRYGQDSDYPGGEAPSNLIDGDDGTKYLNFGQVNSGFIVTPAAGADIVKTFRITTANDAEERDPSSWVLYGTNDPILSEDNTEGLGGESWSLVDSGALSLPSARGVPGSFVVVDNDTAYSSYKMVFDDLKNTGTANSMQIAEIQFYSTVIPEPSSIVILGMGAIAAVAFARRQMK